jgi:hypothetical protein
MYLFSLSEVSLLSVATLFALSLFVFFNYIIIAVPILLVLSRQEKGGQRERGRTTTRGERFLSNKKAKLSLLICA